MATAVAIALAVAPASATHELSHFGTLQVSDTPVERSGYTGGAQSFPGMFGQRDDAGNPCLGFGDPLPDYRLVVESDRPILSIAVESGGADTTLVVRGPESDPVLRCADDSPGSVDAVLSDRNWSAGTYEVWVGTITPSTQINYRLSVAP
jgi:hypothetical protein